MIFKIFVVFLVMAMVVNLPGHCNAQRWRCAITACNDQVRAYTSSLISVYTMQNKTKAFELQNVTSVKLWFLKTITILKYLILSMGQEDGESKNVTLLQYCLLFNNTNWDVRYQIFIIC